jgi:hypothetical protein
MFQKLKKNEYFCIFLSLPIFCRFFADVLPILTKRCFLDPGDFFPETIFTTLHGETFPREHPHPKCVGNVGSVHPTLGDTSPWNTGKNPQFIQ